MSMKVSLILTTYNRPDELESTMSSIQIQDYSNIEVIIKDGANNKISLIELRDMLLVLNIR